MLLLVAEPVWNGLDAKERAIIVKAAAKSAVFNDNLVSESQSKLMKEVGAKMTVTKPDLGPWRDATKDVYKKFSDVKGFVGLYEAIVELGKNY